MFGENHLGFHKTWAGRSIIFDDELSYILYNYSPFNISQGLKEGLLQEKVVNTMVKEKHRKLLMEDKEQPINGSGFVPPKFIFGKRKY